MSLGRIGALVAAAVSLLPTTVSLGAQDRTASLTHTHYIAADEIDWNYAPAEMDHMTGKTYDERARVFLDNSSEHIGRISRKAVYREYTDASFAALKPRSSEWKHLGFLGPVLRGEPGDTIKIVFRNNAHYPFSMHPHGVVYDQASEGVAGIPPGGTHTYVWTVDPRTAPRAGEPNSKVWLYHSHVNENTSWYLEQNIAKYIPDPKSLQQLRPKSQMMQGEAVDVGFTASNIRDAINGYLFGNVPGLSMQQGETVRWYLIGMGNAIHTAHWHANTVLLDNKSTDVVPLMPAMMQTVDMVAETPGTWMFHCHVSIHLASGMYAHYTVQPAQKRKLTMDNDK